MQFSVDVFQIFWGIYVGVGYFGCYGDMDFFVILQYLQLFEYFNLFQWVWCLVDIVVDKVGVIVIDVDVMQQGVIDGFVGLGKVIVISGNSCVGEIECVIFGIYYYFDCIWVKCFFCIMDWYCQGCYFVVVGSQIFCYLVDNCWGDYWFIVLNIDDNGVIVECVFFYYFCQLFGVGLMVGVGYIDFVVGGFNCLGDIFVIGGDNNVICVGFVSVFQYMDNYWFIINVLQWFFWQVCGGEMCRNNDYEIYE